MPRREFTVGTLILLAALAGRTSAQPPATPATAADGSRAYRAKQVIGTAVAIQGDRGIGTIDDIVFDETGQIEYLLVLNEGKLVSVPWPAARFDPGHHTAVVNVTQEQFRAIPTFTAQQYPNFYTPDYRTQTYRYFGLTPGQDRRIDRRIERRDDRQDRR